MKLISSLRRIKLLRRRPKKKKKKTKLKGKLRGRLLCRHKLTLSLLWLRSMEAKRNSRNNLNSLRRLELLLPSREIKNKLKKKTLRWSKKEKNGLRQEPGELMDSYCRNQSQNLWEKSVKKMEVKAARMSKKKVLWAETMQNHKIRTKRRKIQKMLIMRRQKKSLIRLKPLQPKLRKKTKK